MQDTTKSSLSGENKVREFSRAFGHSGVLVIKMYLAGQWFSSTRKKSGPTEIWTRIAGFRVQSANHYTIGPNTQLLIPVNIITLTLSQLSKTFSTSSERYKSTLKNYGTSDGVQIMQVWILVVAFLIKENWVEICGSQHEIIYTGQWIRKQSKMYNMITTKLNKHMILTQHKISTA